MLSVIVFSKERTLQLHGYLESILEFSDITANHISVIYKENEDISYEKTISFFPSINWIKETNFIDDLRRTILKSNDYIMFGCDDVVFKSQFSSLFAIDVLSKDERIFGFSLRLGKNIKPLPKIVYNHLEYFVWNWKKCGVAHYNYPWELDATIYRKSDILDIIAHASNEFKNPNFLEGNVAINANKIIFKDLLASFKYSKCFVITVNRVQNTHPNSFDSSANTCIEMLHKKYLNGDRLDISAISKMKNRKIHVNSKYFVLKNLNDESESFFRKIVRIVLG